MFDFVLAQGGDETNVIWVVAFLVALLVFFVLALVLIKFAAIWVQALHVQGGDHPPRPHRHEPAEGQGPGHRPGQDHDRPGRDEPGDPGARGPLPGGRQTFPGWSWP